MLIIVVSVSDAEQHYYSTPFDVTSKMWSATTTTTDITDKEGPRHVTALYDWIIASWLRDDRVGRWNLSRNWVSRNNGTSQPPTNVTSPQNKKTLFVIHVGGAKLKSLRENSDVMPKEDKELISRTNLRKPIHLYRHSLCRSHPPTHKNSERIRH